ncbi:PIN-like domain-containing protein [Streptomyces sp. NBC_01190]|uniref:PIN-like domain-containing protein n=1 Tax=Streptomyces sp. NBC_01190 TaxID=2903767 RepID=UPI00386D4CD2|nr:PIN-like domain-containing protein [Streptomyces sp. NBC_01190]
MSTFLSAFEGHWRRPAADYKKAVAGYRIAVDTNVLLELYRFTPKARNELLNVLRQVRHRLWIPHQVAAEYYDRRVSAVKEHLTLYTSVPDAVNEHKQKALQELQRFAKRCSMSEADRARLIEPIERAFAAVDLEITRHREDFDLSLEGVINEDPVLTALGEILDDRVGDPFSEEESAALILECRRRFDDKVPPGYKDAGKSENAHGDFFVWEQLLRESEQDSSPFLFVTNDAKEDWVRVEAGLIVGARPELFAEFSERCDADFLITQLGRFLQLAKEELDAPVSESTVAQAGIPRTRLPQQDGERLVLPSSHFGEIVAVLDAEANAMSRPSRNRPSAAPAGRIKRRAVEAKRVRDQLLDSARQSGDDVEVRLGRGDWTYAYALWQQDRRGRSEQEQELPGGDRPPFSADWQALSELEARLTSYQRDYARLLSLTDEEPTGDGHPLENTHLLSPGETGTPTATLAASITLVETEIATLLDRMRTPAAPTSPIP